MLSAPDIQERFQRNLARVHNILEHFSSLNTAPGRPTTLKADLLRAALLLLHATLEDLLRSTEELRLLQAPEKAFARVKWMPPRAVDEPQEKLKETLTLVDLAAYRGKTVDEVLMRAFQKHHERSNYNNENDVVGSLERMGLQKQPFEPFLKDLAAMMARRHRIAHRADLNTEIGRGQHFANPIGRKAVTHWFEVVEKFGNQLVSMV